MPFPLFDRSRLVLRPLAERDHDVHLPDLARLSDPLPPYDGADIPEIGRRIVAARRAGSADHLDDGRHVIKLGLAAT